MGRISRKAVWTLAALVWLMPSQAAAHRGPDSGKTDSLLSRASSSGGDQRVIIRTKPGAQALVGRKLKARGEHVEKLHKLVPAVSARVSSSRLAELAVDPDVESISIDAIVQAHSKTQTSGEPAPPTLRQSLGLPCCFSGSSVTVAIIDSGIQPSPDFDNRIVGFYDFTKGQDGAARFPYDDFGHGTHVAGLIASNGVTSANQYEGVANSAKLLAIKALDRIGAGYTSDVIRALEFVVLNKDRFGVKVVNLSLGHPIYESAATDPLVQAVEAAVRSGLVVVVAAGNYGTNFATGVTGYGGITSPGNAPSAITVGAASTNATIIRSDDRVTRYSSRGPSWYDGIAKPDVVAPGESLVSNRAYGSTLAALFPSATVTTGMSKFLRLSGSSMATAVVSGVVALMLDANHRGFSQPAGIARYVKSTDVSGPRLTANAIKAMLQYSATPLRNASGVAYDHLTQGTGMVNGAGAITLAQYADPAQPVGAYWARTAVAPTTTFGSVEEPWAQAVIWGTRLLRGTSLVEVRQSAYDENIVWGTGEYDIVWGIGNNENIVWGSSIAPGFDVTWAGNVLLEENIVWGTFTAWDENIVWGTGLLGYFDGFNIVWGSMNWEENIVWGTLDDENIVWGTSEKHVTVLGSGGVQ